MELTRINLMCNFWGLNDHVTSLIFDAKILIVADYNFY